MRQWKITTSLVNDEFMNSAKCHNLNGKECRGANASDCIARINKLSCPTFSKQELKDMMNP